MTIKKTEFSTEILFSVSALAGFLFQISAKNRIGTVFLSFFLSIRLNTDCIILCVLRSVHYCCFFFFVFFSPVLFQTVFSNTINHRLAQPRRQFSREDAIDGPARYVVVGGRYAGQAAKRPAVLAALRVRSVRLGLGSVSAESLTLT